MSGRKSKSAAVPTKPGEPRPGVDDALDRAIDSAMREGRPIHGMSRSDRAMTARGRSGAKGGLRLHPETGAVIGEEADTVRPSDGFPHAHAEAEAAMGEGMDVVPTTPDVGAGPQQRIQQIRQRHPEYSKAYELKLFARLYQRNMPMDAIAGLLGISLRTAFNRLKEYKEGCRNLASDFGMLDHVGDGMFFFHDIRGKALQLADDKNLKPHLRLQALGQASAAMNDLTRFLSVTGVYAANPYQRGAEPGGRAEGKDMLFQMEKALLAGPDALLEVLTDATGGQDDRDDDTKPRLL